MSLLTSPARKLVVVVLTCGSRTRIVVLVCGVVSGGGIATGDGGGDGSRRRTTTLVVSQDREITDTGTGILSVVYQINMRELSLLNNYFIREI